MNQPVAFLHKIALVLFQDKKVLMARYKGNQVFYFIGGEIRPGETDIACLLRKTPDELGVSLAPDEIHYLKTFQDKADGRDGVTLTMKVYTGQVLGTPEPTHDVEELRYFSTSDDRSLVSAIATHQVFPWLLTHGYIE